MLSHRRAARDFLICVDRSTFLDVVYKAKITPRQRDILYRYLLDKKDCGFIAYEMATSTETIKKDLQKAYDLIYNYLLSTNLIPNSNHLLAYNLAKR